MLAWSMMNLAKAASVSVSTVKRMEMAEPQPVSEASCTRVRLAFEEVGVRFLSDMDRGVGLQLDAEARGSAHSQAKTSDHALAPTNSLSPSPMWQPRQAGQNALNRRQPRHFDR